ncbi:MAG: prohibitin family protein [Bdellovibrionales bacterium]|nr:prohibitin family protein [Bdellovibrionales bacterium]
MKEYRELISFALLGFVFLIGFISLRIVPVGHLGVIKNWGKVTHDNVLAEGWHFVIPVKTTVEYINIKLLKFQDKATASSKDLQDVSTEVSIQYSMNEVSDLYQKVGTKEVVSNIVLMPAVQESVKAVTAKYTAEELIKKRPEVKTEINKAIQEFLNETLNKKGLSEKSLIMANVAITAFDFSEEFNRSIEMKVRAEQQALQAKNEKLKKITDAEAIAEKIKIESIATANAIKREAKALRENPLLIEYKRMEKWDGKLPEVTGGAIPMFDVKKYKENTR